jgi:hypothetical protein
MKQLKLYQIDFTPVCPVPKGLIILAYSNKEAMNIARETLDHTEPKKATCIKIDKPKVVFFEPGVY